MLTQLLLSIGLPMIIIPLVATAGYFALRCFRARKVDNGDVELQSIVSSSNGKTLQSDSEYSSSKVNPAFATNSAQLPRIAFR
jgi:hypothetical protein